jgi:hypothetical protein
MELPLTNAELLKNVTVASPCSARWDEMSGDERSRFCSECRLHVYNLSAMTSQQAAALIREKEGNLCVRFYRRADGTLLTSDCPVGLRQRLRRQVRRAGAIVASFAAALMSISCDESGRSRSPGNDVSTAKDSDTVHMGEPVWPSATEKAPTRAQMPATGNEPKDQARR